MINRVRRTWETNSSSCHQISVDMDANKTPKDFKVPEKLVIEIGEFGWEKVMYDTIEGRVSYLVTGMLYCDNESDFDAYLIRLLKFLEANGVKEVVLPEPGDLTKGSGLLKYHGYDGYIDHGDEYWSHTLKSILDNDDFLGRFLFLDTSYVKTDGNG